jgi:hypothetical protein
MEMNYYFSKEDHFKQEEHNKAVFPLFESIDLNDNRILMPVYGELKTVGICHLQDLEKDFALVADIKRDVAKIDCKGIEVMGHNFNFVFELTITGVFFVDASQIKRKIFTVRRHTERACFDCFFSEFGINSDYIFNE